MNAANRPTSFVFSSALTADARDQVERLIFFNPLQEKMEEGIRHVVERYGRPRIRVEDDRLHLDLDSAIQTQALFVSARGRPVGAIIFTRETNVLVALYVAVDEDYTAHGPRRRDKLMIRMIRELDAIGRRVRGVEALHLFLGGTTPVRKRIRRP